MCACGVEDPDAERSLAVMRSRFALLTWEFEDQGFEGEGFEDQGEDTVIRLTNQVTSFTGHDMIDGHRWGHLTALEQLRDFVEQILIRIGLG